MVKQKDLIPKAVKTLKDGGVIIYPTDTLYGLGVDATNEKAIMKLFKIKQRDKGKPILVAFDNIKSVKKYVRWNKNAGLLSKRFLPGPLSIVLTLKGKKIPKAITGGSNKIGIRIPNHEFVLSLVSKFKKPITTTSANISGGKNPAKVEDIPIEIKRRVDMIIDLGGCPLKAPSTVVDMSGDTPIILREGAISKEKIFNVLVG